MNWQTFSYLIPYIISALISLSVAFHTFRQKNVTGARVFSGIAFSQALWTLGYIFELSVPTLEGKIFWDDFQWVAGIGWYWGFLVFSIQYSGWHFKRVGPVWIVIGLVPLAFFILVVTNGMTHLIREDAWLVPGEPFSALEYGFTPAVLFFTFLFYVFFFMGLFFLARKLIQSPRIQRNQLWIILIGTLIPMASTVLNLLEVQIGITRDNTPIAFAISNLLILYGLTRFKLFNIQPIASRFIIENMVEPVIVLDVENMVVDQNPAARILTGASIPDLHGQPAADVFSAWPDLVDKIQGAEQFVGEIVIGVGEENRRKEYRLFISPLRSRAGIRQGSVILAREITPLDIVESALKEEEEKFRRLVETTADWVWTIDTEGILTYSNQAVEYLLGYSVENILEEPIFPMIHPDQKLEIQWLLDVSIKNKSGWKNMPIRWLHNDRHPKVFESSALPILDSSGNVTGFSGIDHDVTERHEMEEQLRRSKDELETLVIERTQELYQSEENYRTVVENADEGIWILKEDRTVFVNPKASEITGYSQQELLATPWLDLIHVGNQSDVIEVVDRFTKGEIEDVDIGDFRMVDKQGRVRWVESKTTLITWEDEPAILTLVSDITEEVLAEEEMQRLFEAEQQARRTAESMQAASLALTKTLDLDKVLDTLLSVIADLIPYDSANLFLYEDDRFLTSRASRGSVINPRGSYIEVSTFEADRLPIFSRIIETHKSLLIPDIAATDWASQPETAHVNSWIGTPLLSGGKIIGLLSLNHTEPNFYTEKHKTLAELLAVQATIAIQNADLFEQTLQHTRELEDITDISSALRLKNHQDEMFEVLLEKASASLEVDAGAIFLLENDSMQLANVIGPKNTGENISRHEPTMELIGEVAQSTEPLYLAEQPSDSRYEEDKNSLALLPVKTSEGTIGVMVLAWIEADEFSEETKRLLNVFVEIVGNTLERARILETLEQQVADRTRDLSVLYQVTSVGSAHRDLGSITRNALKEILVAVNGNIGTIHICEPDGDFFHLVTQQGIPEALLEDLSILPVDGKFIGSISERNEPLVIMDYKHDPRVPETLQRLDCEVYIGTPIRIRDQIRGVLSVYLETPQQYNTDNVRLLMMVVDQLGIALERAQLQEQAEEAVVIEERQRLARELHDAVTQSLYSLTLMADAARKFNDQSMWARSEHYLRMVQSTAKEVLKEMRLLVFELRPTALEEEGFVNALRQRLETVETRSRVETNFDVEEIVAPRIDVQVALYRIAQEALNNALKHSQATSMTVKYFADKDRVSLRISDDGHGFDPDQVQGGIGLRSMRERVEKLGGEFSVVSDDSGGTSINVEIEEKGRWTKL